MIEVSKARLSLELGRAGSQEKVLEEEEGRALGDETWGRWREKTVSSELSEEKERWEKHNRNMQRRLFPRSLVHCRTFRKAIAEVMESGFGKAILWSMTGFILLLMGNNLQEKRETERNQE